MAGQKESAGLRFLYHTAFGRVLLKILSARWISKCVGAFLNTRFSKPLIKKFVRKNKIDLSLYESDGFRCFNDCFCRKIRDGLRPIAPEESALISPCDGLLRAWRITEGSVIPVKQSRYTISDLLGDASLAKQFDGGVCLVFRLCVNHYHRYCYPDDGEKGENIFLPGKLHTVRPIALEAYPVFVENCREYTLLKTEHFGNVVQMEVGAMLVGKIQNDHGAGRICKGQEKGRFLYGGSTIILLLEKDRVILPERFFAEGETDVLMGEAIGTAMGQT